MQSNQVLHWNDRPLEVKNTIDQTFNSFKDRTIDQWCYRGEGTEYLMSGIKEYALVKAIIKKEPERKEFWVLDIGAGAFGFGRGLVDAINRDSEIPSDIKLHVIGLRGETHEDRVAVENGKCIVYEFGRFAIENLHNEFVARGLGLNKKIDVIVSRWTFCHLVDPIGTFIQAYELLKPLTGLLLADGFCFELNDQTGRELNIYNDNTRRFLQHANIPYLVTFWKVGCAMDQFVIRRHNAASLSLHLRYHLIKKSMRSGKDMTCFNSTPDTFEMGMLWFHVKDGVSVGDGDLYQWLNHLGVFNQVQPFFDIKMYDERVALVRKQFNLDAKFAWINSINVTEVREQEIIRPLFGKLAKEYINLRLIFEQIQSEYAQTNNEDTRLVLANAMCQIKEALRKIYDKRNSPFLVDVEFVATPDTRIALLADIREIAYEFVDKRYHADIAEVFKQSYAQGFLDQRMSPRRFVVDVAKKICELSSKVYTEDLLGNSCNYKKKLAI